MSAMSRLAGALDDLARAFGSEEMGSDVGGHMTCTEADTFADVLACGGHKDAAVQFLLGHSRHDEMDDLHDGWWGKDFDPEKDTPSTQQWRAALQIADAYVTENLG